MKRKERAQDTYAEDIKAAAEDIKAAAEDTE